MARELEAWEDEGGAAPAPLLEAAAGSLSGTASQVEWAEHIRRQVAAEFDRVAASFRSVAAKQQSEDMRADTRTVLEILDDKRADVMSREQAGYFIHDWQEIGGQVLQLILQDPRYEAIKAHRAARQRSAQRVRSLQR